MKQPSQAKVEANRANAKKSSGPKTDQGKAKSKLNAVKHGIYATTVLLDGEDRALYESIKSEQRKRYQPKNFIEEALVAQLISELWTLRRIMRAEYLFARDIQVQSEKLPRTLALPATAREKKVMQLMEENPDELALQLAQADKIQKQLKEPEALSASEKKAVNILKVYRKIEEKEKRLPEVYLDIFLYAHQENVQKLVWLRRHALQTILALERELEKRLRARKERAIFKKKVAET